MAITGEALRASKVLFDRVLIEVRKPTETTSKGGIILPAGDAVVEKNVGNAVEGVVIATGPGVWTKKDKFIETRAKVGQRVLFAQHSGEKVPVHLGFDVACDYFVIYDDEVIAVLEGDGEAVTVGSEAA